MGASRRAPWIATLVSVVGGAALAPAHELEASRATLVLREPGLVSLSLYVDYPSLLQRSLAPQDSLEQFLFTAAAMPPEKFRAALERAQSSLQSGTRLVLAGGRPQAFARWNWPDAVRVQQLLRDRVMQQVAAPAAHPPDTTMEVQAEVLLPSPAASLRVQLAPAFGRVLVVWYRPGQQWIEPGVVSSELSFR